MYRMRNSAVDNKYITHHPIFCEMTVMDSSGLVSRCSVMFAKMKACKSV